MTKVILRDDVWRYTYSRMWTDKHLLPIKPEHPTLTPVRYFPDELEVALFEYNIFAFLRERETLPDLNGLRVVDSVEFTNEKDALAFILKYGDYFKHNN